MPDDAKMLAAATLAAIQDPIKEVTTLYKKMVRRLDAANLILNEDEQKKKLSRVSDDVDAG